jgi:amino acid transporter
MNSPVISLLFIVALCIIFWLFFIRPKRNAIKEEIDPKTLKKPSKGASAAIGAVGGFLLLDLILTGLDKSDKMFIQDLNSWTFMLLLPGAIIGAIIGLAYGDKSNSKSEKSDSETIQTIKQDLASELMSYKKLLDEGVITQEEFDKKKQEILERK